MLTETQVQSVYVAMPQNPSLAELNQSEAWIIQSLFPSFAYLAQNHKDYLAAVQVRSFKQICQELQQCQYELSEAKRTSVRICNRTFSLLIDALKVATLAMGIMGTFMMIFGEGKTGVGGLFMLLFSLPAAMILAILHIGAEQKLGDGSQGEWNFCLTKKAFAREAFLYAQLEELTAEQSSRLKMVEDFYDKASSHLKADLRHFALNALERRAELEQIGFSRHNMIAELEEPVFLEKVLARHGNLLSIWLNLKANQPAQ